MTIEADNGGRRPCIPDSNASICVPNGEDIRVDIAPANDGDLFSAACIAPPAQQLTLLHIPAEDFFICCSVCASCSRGLSTGLYGFGSPDEVRGGCRDNAKSVALLILAVWKSVESVVSLRLHAYLYDLTMMRH